MPLVRVYDSAISAADAVQSLLGATASSTNNVHQIIYIIYIDIYVMLEADQGPRSVCLLVTSFMTMC